ncbi:glycosyltransferase [bacterium]|nr:glycosyltransferase [bacterium]
MWMSGINPIVIHNGIPEHILKPVNKSDIKTLRRIFPDLLLTKVGRYDVDKRWVMAIRSVGVMKLMGMRPTLIARGGKEYHRNEVMAEAARQGLSVKELHLPSKAPKEQVFAELEKAKDYDIIELCFYVSEEVINILYGGSDCVLANSGHEPFGLVGLEVMACGGLAFVGATGEDYAQTMVNSVVIETENELEIVEYIRTLMKDEQLQKRIRKSGKYTASQFTWNTIVLDLMQKVRFLAASHGVLIG